MTDRSEHGIQNDIRLALSGHATMFRNNVGTAWTGDVQRLRDGSILIRNPRPFHAGLMVGSGDLIGWRSVEITPDMVGKKIAVFASVEVKSLKGKASAAQQNWRKNVINAGGLACVAKSSTEALKGLAIDVKYLYEGGVSRGTARERRRNP